VGKTIREKTSLLPGSCAPSGHLRAVGVSPFTCPPPATGKGSLLKTTFKALRRVSLCPWRIGAITAAALVLLHHEHGRTT
jgi:hypothetical protein